MDLKIHPSGGQYLTGGTGPNGGEGLTGGTGLNGGQGPTGGTGLNGGEGPTGGTGLNGGEGLTEGTGPNGGQGVTGPSSDENSEGSASTPLMQILFNSTDTSGGAWGIAGGLLKDLNRWGTSFLKPLLEGGTATYAGFNFQQNSAGNYKAVGKTKINNKFFNMFYDNYKKYDINGEKKYIPVGGNTQEPYKVKSFFESNNLMQTRKDFFKTTWNNLKSSLNENYNVVSKKFRSFSNLLKLNGPIGIMADIATNF